MAFTITKRFEFSASHQLTHLAEKQPDHQCARLHGHNYVVEMELKALFTNHDGFVRDYGELAVVKQFIDRVLDHRHLNEVLGDSWNTTAENMARWLYATFKPMVPELAAVRVMETPKTCAEYRAGGAL
jgi:6-pyruvoyltetrahydropterin/6-carboxytetrahydropterin synthase